MILHECSCIIECIKRVGENDKMRGFDEQLIDFPNEFDKFNNNGTRTQDSIYQMTTKSHLIPDFRINTRFEPPQDKTNKMACASSEDSDQPGHPPSLIKSLRCPHEESLVP